MHVLLFNSLEEIVYNCVCTATATVTKETSACHVYTDELQHELKTERGKKKNGCVSADIMNHV